MGKHGSIVLLDSERQEALRSNFSGAVDQQAGRR
jgi:hypothetical protein